MIKWAKFSANMVKDYERQLTKTGRTKIGEKGYGISMHTTEDLTDGDSLTEAVPKYAERATQAEEIMAQMKAKSKEKIAMMSMQTPPPPPC